MDGRSLAPRQELNARSVAVALVVAALIGASYPLIVLKLGFGPNISVVSAFFGYLLLSAVGLFTGLRPNRLENNLVQTAGTTAGQAGFMCVLLAAFDMLNSKPELHFSVHLTAVQTFLWLTVAGLLGVLLAVPLRRHYLETENLPFADGVATGETLTVLEDPKKAKSRARVLGLGLGMSGTVTWLQLGYPASLRFLPEALYFGASGKALRLGLNWSLLSFGTGLLVGARVTLSMGLGMLASWVVLPPLLFERHVIEGLTFAQTVRWVMWPATGLMVSGGLTTLALKWRLVLKTFGSFRMAELSGSGSTDFPMRWVLGGVVTLGAALCLIQSVSLGMPVWATLSSLVLSVPLMLVGIQVLGETNWAPISVMANMMQGLFAVLMPGQVTANMIASGMSGTIAGHGETLMQDYKAGQIVGASNRHLTYLQLAAVPVGSLAVALVYPVLRDRYGVVDQPGHAAELSSPVSVKWAGFAELLSRGLGALPAGCGTALLVGCAAGVALALGESTRHRRFVPSATGIGIGMLIPGASVMAMVAGALAHSGWRWRARASQEAFSVPLASGFIAGEALVAVVLAVAAAVALATGVDLRGK